MLFIAILAVTISSFFFLITIRLIGPKFIRFLFFKLTLPLILMAFLVIQIVLIILTRNSIGDSLIMLLSGFYLFSASLFRYFCLQKFSLRIDKPMILIKKPNAYTPSVYISFGYLIYNIYSFSNWYLLMLIPFTYLLLGYLSAEISLSKLNGKGMERRLAIFAINDENGRNSLLKNRLYIFP